MEQTYDWILTSVFSEDDFVGTEIYKNYTAEEAKEILLNYIRSDKDSAENNHYSVYSATLDPEDIKISRGDDGIPEEMCGNIMFDDFHYSYSIKRMDTLEKYKNEKA